MDKDYLDVLMLGNGKDFDYFPEYEGTEATGIDARIIDSMRDGTYRLNMRLSAYDGKWSHKHRTLTASIQDQKLPVPDDQKTLVASLENDAMREMAKRYERDMVPIARRYLSNVKQYYDYVLLNDGFANSPAGAIIDTWVEFVIPRRLKPVLKLREPSKNADADSKEIEKHKDIIDKLVRIDDWYSDMGPERSSKYYTNGWQDKVKSALRSCETYGRCSIAMENWPASDGYGPVTVGREEYKTIPNTLKIVEPIEMGMTEVELYSGRMAGCWLHNNVMYLPAEHMVYLVNDYDSPMIGAQTYGFTKLQRCLDLTRLYRRLMALNFPQYLKVSASGMGIFIANTQGYPAEVRKRMRNALRSIWRSAEIAVIDTGHVDSFKFEEMKINTDIQHLTILHDMLMKTMANVLGTPQAIVYDDQNRARATLIGRLTTYINYQVAGKRRVLAHQLASQRYMPNFRAVCIQDGCPDLLEKFYVDVEFEEPALETKQERIDRLIKENELYPYTLEWIGKQLEDPDYIRHVDMDRKKMLDKILVESSAKPEQAGAGKPKKPGATGKTHSVKNETGNQSPTVSGS